jgi:hypothetical protein
MRPRLGSRRCSRHTARPEPTEADIPPIAPWQVSKNDKERFPVEVFVWQGTTREQPGGPWQARDNARPAGPAWGDGVGFGAQPRLRKTK